MLKILFLDIDGVLLPFPPPSQQRSGNNDDDDDDDDDDRSGDDTHDHHLFPRYTVEALQRLIQHTSAHLVLSSTWRVRKDFVRDILECLQAYGMDIEEFYDTTDTTLHSERQWEIADWLLKKKQKKQQMKKQPPNDGPICWLALDDEELIQGDSNKKHTELFQGHVIKTTSNIGLTMSDVDTAIGLWDAQLQVLGGTTTTRRT